MLSDMIVDLNTNEMRAIVESDNRQKSRDRRKRKGKRRRAGNKGREKERRVEIYH